jgi:hypothetical protein
METRKDKTFKSAGAGGERKPYQVRILYSMKIFSKSKVKYKHSKMNARKLAKLITRRDLL